MTWDERYALPPFEGDFKSENLHPSLGNLTKIPGPGTESSPQGGLDHVDRVDLEPICFRTIQGDANASLELGEVARSDEALNGAPRGCNFLLGRRKGPAKPDISAGLGRQQIKRDIVALAKYVKSKESLLVHDACLFAYDGRCWNKLDGRRDCTQILDFLRGDGYDDCLLPADLRRIRDLLLIDPELQHQEELLPPHNTINLADCSLDVLNDRYYQHDPRDLFTSYINIAREDLDNPSYGEIFEQFVTTISDGDPNVRTQLLELTAIALLRPELKVFYVLLGPSNTGKTQYGRFLTELIGHEHVAALRDIGDFKDKWTTGGIADAQLVTCLDLPNSKLSPAAIATLKQLVGDDCVKVEKKHENPSTIYQKPLLLFATNQPIQISNKEDQTAFLGRMVVIPFSGTCSEADRANQLFPYFLHESAYILNEAIKVYRNLVARNYQVTRADLPAEYLLHQGASAIEAVRRFLTEKCRFAPEYEVSTADLWAAYQHFAAVQGLQEQSLISFSRVLREVLTTLPWPTSEQKRIRGTGNRGYQGLDVLN